MKDPSWLKIWPEPVRAESESAVAPSLKFSCFRLIESSIPKIKIQTLYDKELQLNSEAAWTSLRRLLKITLNPRKITRICQPYSPANQDPEIMTFLTLSGRFLSQNTASTRPNSPKNENSPRYIKKNIIAWLPRFLYHFVLFLIMKNVIISLQC